MDHDQRFKTLIREFFSEFMELFFSDWATRLDLANIEWLEQELFPDPPEGERHVVDLVAKVESTTPADEPTPALLLVHIEIESPDRTTELKPRLQFYYHHLREKHQLPVLPIVVYLKVGLDGMGIDSYVETVGEMEVNRFQYLYVGLPALDAVEYLQGSNWLGVALSALMKIPPERVAWLGAEALRRLAGATLSEQRRFLLGECVHSYLSLDDKQREEYEQLLRTTPYSEAQTMNQTVYEKGLEKGLEEGQVRLVLIQLEKKFPPLPEATREYVRRSSSEELERIAEEILTAESLEELGLPS